MAEKIGRVQKYVYQPYDLESVWGGVYEKKRLESEKPFVPSEKHQQYLEAFRSLGFFDDLHNDPFFLVQLGLGHGRTLRTIVEEVYGDSHVNTIGLDISLPALKHALMVNHVDSVVAGDIVRLPFDNNLVERVFEVGVVEHQVITDPSGDQIVDTANVLASFKELLRVLKPGGKAGFIQPHAISTQGFQKRVSQLLGRWNMGFQHDYHVVEFCRLLEAVGFVDIQYLIMQAPQDFPRVVRIGDTVLRKAYTMRGNTSKAEMCGALFAVVATKPS